MSFGSRGGVSRGFSLIELAVVIFIVGLLLGSIFLPLQSRVEAGRITDTQKILDNAREALIGFAAANGRFPCPAFATSMEDVADLPTGLCGSDVTFTGVYVGFLPAATLGFTPVDASGYAVDAWGLTQNRIRYAVSRQTINSITRPFTRPSGMRSAGMSSIASNSSLLYVCNSGTDVTTSNCGTNPGTLTLASSVPVVIWSLGANAATGTGTDETKNLDSDRVFVSRIRAAAGEAGGELGQFDDIVTWIGLPTLFSRLIAAGQLP